MRRSLPTVFVIATFVLASVPACAPKDQPSADTADAILAPDSVGATGAATATPLPAAPDSSGARASGTATATAPTPKRSAHPAPARTTTDTGAAPRIKPPTKAPGGSIVLPPRTTHDSLRMAPPVTPGTATRP